MKNGETKIAFQPKIEGSQLCIYIIKDMIKKNSEKTKMETREKNQKNTTLLKNKTQMNTRILPHGFVLHK